MCVCASQGTRLSCCAWSSKIGIRGSFGQSVSCRLRISLMRWLSADFGVFFMISRRLSTSSELAFSPSKKWRRAELGGRILKIGRRGRRARLAGAGL